MRILHIVHNYSPSIGGSQLLFQKFSEGLVLNFNDEVTIFTTNSLYGPNATLFKEISVEEEIINGVNVIRYPFHRHHLKYIQYLNRLANKISPIVADYCSLLYKGPISYPMWRAIKKFNGDIIGATPFNYLHMYYPIIGKKRLPVVHYGALHIKNGKVPRTVLNAIFVSDGYIANTVFEKNILLSYGIPSEKLFTVGPGVDISNFEESSGEAIRKKFNLRNAPVVAFIGRITSYKGVDTLIYAMQEVWKKIPEAYLLIAGSSTIYAEKLLLIIENLPEESQKRIIWIQNFLNEDKAELFAACDVFVSVSKEESFGIVYLEAWASKKPVIGGKIGAVSSVITNNQNGILVDYGDIAALAKGIIKLLEDKKFSNFLANNGYEKTKQNYSWETVTQKLRSVYQTVLNKNSRKLHS